MSRAVIEFAETVPTSRCLYIHEDAFTYQPKRGWVWLQALCFWFLKAIGCYACTEWTSYRRVVVDREVTMAEIFRQQQSLAASLGQGGEILLIGAEDWMNILNSEALQFHPMTFDGEYRVPRMFTDGDRGYSKRTMRVCVIPWMKGMVLVPKEAIQ